MTQLQNEPSQPPSPPDRPVSTSREIKLALLKHLGIPATRVCDVELDLTDVIAMVKVTIAVPACVNGLIATEIEQYELVRRTDRESNPEEASAELKSLRKDHEDLKRLLDSRWSEPLPRTAASPPDKSGSDPDQGSPR